MQYTAIYIVNQTSSCDGFHSWPLLLSWRLWYLVLHTCCLLSRQSCLMLLLHLAYVCNAAACVPRFRPLPRAAHYLDPTLSPLLPPRFRNLSPTSLPLPAEPLKSVLSGASLVCIPSYYCITLVACPRGSRDHSSAPVTFKSRYLHSAQLHSLPRLCTCLMVKQIPSQRIHSQWCLLTR